MKWRPALATAGILLVLAAAADSAAWLFVTRSLRDGIAAWALRQRAQGMSVVLDEKAAGGWPLAADMQYEARLGPEGMPAGVVLRAVMTSSLSPAHPRTVRTDIARAQLTTPNGAELVATANAWTVEAPLAAEDHLTMRATDLRLVWGAHAAKVAMLAGAQTGSHVTLQAQQIDLAASGLALPPALGATAHSLDLDAMLHGGLPEAALSQTASARAWQESGGSIELARLAVRYGPLDASLQGRVGLDSALRPAGSGVAKARGLVALLDGLGASGAIPAHAGQAASGVLALLGGGDDGPVEIPFSLANGTLSVAGFPVARLPRLPWEAQ